MCLSWPFVFGFCLFTNISIRFDLMSVWAFYDGNKSNFMFVFSINGFNYMICIWFLTSSIFNVFPRNVTKSYLCRIYKNHYAYTLALGSIWKNVISSISGNKMAIKCQLSSKRRSFLIPNTTSYVNLDTIVIWISL